MITIRKCPPRAFVDALEDLMRDPEKIQREKT
jgi:hypothetical protein